MKITTKITLITILAMVSMVGITAYAFLTTNKVKVTGDLYNKIEINSDLTADILPPPFYLIETYLTTYQIITNYKNLSLIQQIKTLQQLKREYFDRYNYWMQTLPEGELKKTVTVLAFSSSERFFKVLDNDFIPALQDRDITTATIILNQTLTPIYLEHKRFIDSAVKMAEDESNKLEEETTRSLKFSVTLMIIVPLVFIVIIFIIGSLIKTTISISMKKVLKGFQITSEGDLRYVVENLSKDELGTISSYLNKMTKNMSRMIGDVKNTSLNLSETSLLLSNNMNSTADSIEDITNSIKHIDGQMNRQMSGVQEAQIAIDEIVNRIEALNIQIEDQSSSVTQSSSAVEEMVANISSVNSILKKNSLSVDQLKKASELGKVGMGEVADNINGIRNESEGLIEATNIIQNIASQTNLLAMNAAIEAAHAGDAGKGFAVVADEIRKLAEDSNNQVESISQILNKFKNSITTVAEYSDSTQRQFEQIFNLSTIVSDQENIISSAMEEQNTGGAEILNAMRQISEITETVREYSSEIMDNSHGVIIEMKTLNTISHEVNDKVNQMSNNSVKISKSSNETQILSQKNKESIDNLLIEISSFKIDND